MIEQQTEGMLINMLYPKKNINQTADKPQ
ncbi:hypothetical protein S96127_1629 [Yersinia pestis]|nr:hypothetical protein S96127_1629 [Yersinia pestis]